MKTKSLCIVVACLLAGLSAAAQTAPSATPATKPAARTGAAAAKPAAPFEAALLHPATLIAKAPEMYDVKFETTAGDFTVHVTRAWAPRGADRFYNLVRHHFYDGAAFFRVLPGFMAQFGISAYPQVSAAWEEATIKDDPVAQSNRPGYITYAMAGPNTRTTQVFINYGNNQALDSMGFAPFGNVTDGMEVVNKLYGGYGEGAPDGHGPDQNAISKQGHTYLEKGFSKLDVIKSATLVTTPAAAPAPSK